MDTYEQKENLFETKELLQYSLFFVGIISVFLITKSIHQSPTSATALVTTATETAITPPNPFESVSFRSQAAAVYDVNSESFLFTTNADAPLALASLTKLMTAVVAVESAPENKTITIPRTALLKEGDSGLQLGETWNLSELIDYMMVVSSNDGAAALAISIGAQPLPGQGDGTPTPYPDPEARFISRMNATANRLNLRNMHFNNESGLDSTANQGGSYGSARDVAKLMAYTLINHPEILKETTKTKTTISSLEKTREAINTNPFVDTIPGIIGSKTGFTDIAGGNLVVAFDAGFNQPVVVVVLGSTPESRFTDVDTLIYATRQWFANQP